MLKPLRQRQRVLSERPVSAFVGLEGASFGLESCPSAEEAYLFDKRTSIEIESFVSLRGHSTVVAFSRLEKGTQYFIAVPVIGIGAFHDFRCKTRYCKERVCSGIA